MTLDPVIYLARMQQRYASEAEWEAADPELLIGEFGIQFDPETPSNIRLKLGHGATWSETPWLHDGTGGGNTDLDYNPATRYLDSSTGDGVTLPLATTTTAGLLPARTGAAGTFLAVGGDWAVPPGVCDLSYDAGSRLLTSSTGQDVTLPLVGTVVGGTPVAGLQTAEEAARLAETGSPTFAGLTVTGTATLSHIHGALAGPVYQHVRNASGAPMAALTPYRIAEPGTQGDTDRATIFPARADDPALMPAVGILSGALAANADGHGEVAGVISGVNTSGMTPGAPLYVGATGGLVTTPPPANVQVVAVVGRVHASTGSLVVQVGTMRPTAGEVGADPAGTAAAAVAAHAGASGAHTAAQVGADPAGTAAAVVGTHAAASGAHTIAGVTGLQTALDSKAPATLTVVSVTYAATVNIDFAAYNGTIVVIGTLTGNLQLTFSNIATGRMCSVSLTCDATARNLTFPASAPFLGTKPSSIAAGKRARVSFECLGSTEASVDCGYAVQQ